MVKFILTQKSNRELIDSLFTRSLVKFKRETHPGTFDIILEEPINGKPGLYSLQIDLVGIEYLYTIIHKEYNIDFDSSFGLLYPNILDIVIVY